MSTDHADTYPGNKMLPADVREKVLSTFGHTLAMYRTGNYGDCIMGCEFILKLDHRFAPARSLMQKANNPKAEIDVDELEKMALNGSPPDESSTPETRLSPETPMSPDLDLRTEASAPADLLVGNSSESTFALGTASEAEDSSFIAPPSVPFHAADSPGDGTEPAAPGESADPQIQALLKQGEEAEMRGHRQQAIEIWSRIFVTDINNADAVTRIENARQEMADEARRVSEYLKKGRDSFEAGDRDGARDAFLKVLALDPDEPTSRFYLDRMKERQAPQEKAALPGEPTAPAKAPPRASAATGLFEPLPVPPASRHRISLLDPNVLAVVGGFVVLTIAGMYLVFHYGGKSSASAAKAAAGSAAPGPLSEARRKGAAQPLDGTASPGARPAGQPGEAPASSAMNDAPRLRSAAEKALQERRYIEAFKNFNLAAPAFRDDPTFAQQMGVAADKVTALTPAVKLYNEGEYDTAIPILWRIYQEDRDNQDARSYLFRSYFNQGVTQLQNGLYPQAAQNFQEALNLDPDDVEAVRHRRFTEHYKKGDLDLMGRIYVRHLNHRP